MDLARGSGGKNFAERRGLVRLPRRQAERRCIEQIEKLCAKLHPLFAGEGKALVQRDVKIDQPGPRQDVAAAVAKTVRGRQGERRRVEETVRSLPLQPRTSRQIRTVRPEHAADISRIAVVPAQPRSEGKAGLQRGDRAELPVVQYVPGYSLGMEGRKAEQARECEAVLQMEV